MKRLIAAGVILAMILAVSITGNALIHKYGSEARCLIEDVLTADDGDAPQLAEEFVEYWGSVREILAIFVNHGVINDIGRVASGLHSAAKLGNRDEIIAAADEILFMINRIEEDERLSMFSVM